VEADAGSTAKAVCGWKKDSLLESKRWLIVEIEVGFRKATKRS
jgi:hypothetical protein